MSPGNALFFPEFLGHGSAGPAVNVLGILIMSLGFNDREHPIELDGEFTPDGAIARAVRSLQRKLEFTEGEVDGNFGPDTRARFKDKYGLDVNMLTDSVFAGETVGVVGE